MDGAHPFRVRCFRNAEEIGKYIGENPKYINVLVLEEGLPAWRRNGCGPWRALDIDLDKWLVAQRSKYLPRARRDAEAD